MTRRHGSSKLVWGQDYQTFRQRLVRARELAGLTQRAAAERMGRSQGFVAKSETGERRVDIVELGHFANAYGRSLKYFAPFTEHE